MRAQIPLQDGNTAISGIGPKQVVQQGSPRRCINGFRQESSPKRQRVDIASSAQVAAERTDILNIQDGAAADIALDAEGEVVGLRPTIVMSVICAYTREQRVGREEKT